MYMFAVGPLLLLSIRSNCENGGVARSLLSNDISAQPIPIFHRVTQQCIGITVLSPGLVLNGEIQLLQL